MTRRGWWLFAALAVLWGIPYLLIKVAVRELTPATLVFLRTTGGALLLLPFAVREGRLAELAPRWLPVVAFAGIEIALPWFLLSDAERHLPSSLAGLLIAAVPIVGAVLARLTGSRERLDARRLVGLLVGFGGVVALLGFDVGGGDAVAAAEMAVVVVCYATGPLIVSRKLMGTTSLGVLTASLGLCAVGYAPFGIAQMPSAWPAASAVAAVAALTVLCTSGAFLVFFHLIAEVGAVRGTVVTYLNPAVAVLLGVAFLGEPFGPGTAVGFALILLGSFLSTRPVVPPPRPAPRQGTRP